MRVQHQTFQWWVHHPLTLVLLGLIYGVSGISHLTSCVSSCLCPFCYVKVYFVPRTRLSWHGCLIYPRHSIRDRVSAYMSYVSPVPPSFRCVWLINGRAQLSPGHRSGEVCANVDSSQSERQMFVLARPFWCPGPLQLSRYPLRAHAFQPRMQHSIC